MGIKHKVCINIAEKDGASSPVTRSGTMQIRKKLLDFLFEQQVNVLVLSPRRFGADCRNQRTEGRR